MKKKYLKPELGIAIIRIEQNILGASGVETGGSLGDGYNSNDVTFSRGSSLWDDED